MHRCHVTTAQIEADRIELARDAARHLQTVLRTRPGESVALFDGAGHTRDACIARADRHGLCLEPLSAVVRHPPPACRLTLAACVSKGHRMDWTVEKAVELGAARIVPVISARTVVRLDDPDDAEGKTARWLRVAVEAARQSGAVWLPTIAEPASLSDTLPCLADCRPLLVAALSPLSRRLRQVLADLRLATAPPTDVAWLVGPEGDFTPAELESILAVGALPVSLGHQVLRAETAALYGLSTLNAEWLD